MPCRSYESDWFDSSTSRNIEAVKLKVEADKLARIACKAMYALEKLDPEFKSLKDQESRHWWAKHKVADQKRLANEAKEKAKKAEAAKLRKEALSKLTPEEIKAFGIKV